MSRPSSRNRLDNAIRKVAGLDEAFVAARTIMADTVVAQMLPDGAVKGGSALKIRFGDIATRFSDDLDTARMSNIEEYASDLSEALKVGWEGFTGTLVRKEPRAPKNVPAQYVMQPFEVKLSYLGKSWVTIRLEVGHNEIGDAEEPDMVVPEDAARLFKALEFPEPKPIPLMPIHHQIAQKLHGASEEGSSRAHDLVDLQLIERRGNVDYAKARETCERLFSYRKKQSWPPVVAGGTNWAGLYADAAEGLDVLQSAEDAVSWVNDFIGRIANS